MAQHSEDLDLDDSAHVALNGVVNGWSADKLTLFMKELDTLAKEAAAEQSTDLFIDSLIL